MEQRYLLLQQRLDPWEGRILTLHSLVDLGHSAEVASFHRDRCHLQRGYIGGTSSLFFQQNSALLFSEDPVMCQVINFLTQIEPTLGLQKKHKLQLF